MRQTCKFSTGVTAAAEPALHVYEYNENFPIFN